MNHDEAKAKVAKLMAMAGDGSNASEQEVATALRQAESLMRKHGISLMDLQNATEEQIKFNWDTGFFAFGADRKATQKTPIWFQWMAVGIAKFTDTIVCNAWDLEHGAGVKFKGDQEDVVFALWLAAYLKNALRKATYEAKLGSSTNRETFRKSMALGLSQRMKALRAERDQAYASTGTALVVVNQKIALRDQEFGGESYRTSKRAVSFHHEDAAAKGFAAAKKVQFNRPLTGASNNKRISG